MLNSLLYTTVEVHHPRSRQVTLLSHKHNNKSTRFSLGRKCQYKVLRMQHFHARLVCHPTKRVSYEQATGVTNLKEGPFGLHRPSVGICLDRLTGGDILGNIPMTICQHSLSGTDADRLSESQEKKESNMGAITYEKRPTNERELG